MQINKIPNLILKIDCINCPMSKLLAEIREVSAIDIAMGRDFPTGNEIDSNFNISLRAKKIKFSDFLFYIAVLTDRYWSVIDNKFTLCVLPTIKYYERETQEHMIKSFEILEELKNEYPDLYERMLKVSSSKSEVPFLEFPESLQSKIIDFFGNMKKTYPELSDDVIKNSKIQFFPNSHGNPGSYTYSIFPIGRSSLEGRSMSEENLLIPRKIVLREIDEVKKSGGLIILPNWYEVFPEIKIAKNIRKHNLILDKVIPKIKTTVEHNKFILDIIENQEFILIHRFFRVPDDIEHPDLKLLTLLNDWCQISGKKWAIDENGILLISRLRDLNLTQEDKSRPLQIHMKANVRFQRRPVQSKLEVTLVKNEGVF